MIDTQLSAIVPVAPWHLGRASMLFESLNRYLDPASVHTVYVIFPEQDKMRRTLADLNFAFDHEVLSEQDVVPPEDYAKFRTRKGWYRQQIMKLYIAKRMEAAAYLCLDSDVVCVKPTGFDDLVIDGKPATNIESKSVHERWWTDSRKVLKFPDPGTAEGMTSSTNIFLTEEVLALVDYIENLYGKSFIQALFNWRWVNPRIAIRQWTEYKLYWSFIEHRGQVDAYNRDVPVWGRSIWHDAEQLDDDVFREALSPDGDGHFAILNGNRVDEDLARQMVDTFLDL